MGDLRLVPRVSNPALLSRSSTQRNRDLEVSDPPLAIGLPVAGAATPSQFQVVVRQPDEGVP